MSDLQGYFECQQDKITQRGFMGVPENLAATRKELKGKVSDIGKKKPFGETFAIEVDSEFAGYVELHHLNIKNYEHRGEIGYCAHPKFRGYGIMGKAVKIITNYGFKKYKLKRMFGICRTFNKASARVLEKAGYRLEGIHKKEYKKDGKYLDNMHWSIVR